MLPWRVGTTSQLKENLTKVRAATDLPAMP